MAQFKHEMAFDCAAVIAASKSQAGQDLLVICMTDGRTKGRWLELGAMHPVFVSNTWLLEKCFDWSGISIELIDPGWTLARQEWTAFYTTIRSCFKGKHPDDWIDLPETLWHLPTHIQDDFINLHQYYERSVDWTKPSHQISPPRLYESWSIVRPHTDFVIADATTYAYCHLNGDFDYLQVDIDNSIGSLICLERAVACHDFSVVTFEHDAFVGTEDHIYCRDRARDVMQEHGYQLLANDVTCEPHKGDASLGNGPMYFEDWYVHPEKVDADLVRRYSCITQELRPKYWQEILLA